MLSISSTIKKTPRLSLQPIAEAILGVDYSVSLVYVGSTRARRINQETRGKDYVPNVLSFPLDTTHGEIYICPDAAQKEYRAFNLRYTDYLTYLFIHGALHLKGYDHGAKMDALEKHYCAQCNITI